MSIKKISKEQPDKFEFTLDNLEKVKKIIKKFNGSINPSF